MLGAARRPEGLSGKVAFTLIAEPEKELLHPGPGKGVPGKGNGKCKVFNPTPPPQDPANLPYRAERVWLARLRAWPWVETPEC